jgi:hypothetical protein
MRQAKVYVRMFDSTSFWGKVYLEDKQRVQDLLNDERKFIPVERLDDRRGMDTEDTYHTVCLHKDGIYYMEEI